MLFSVEKINDGHHKYSSAFNSVQKMGKDLPLHRTIDKFLMHPSGLEAFKKSNYYEYLEFSASRLLSKELILIPSKSRPLIPNQDFVHNDYDKWILPNEYIRDLDLNLTGAVLVITPQEIEEKNGLIIHPAEITLIYPLPRIKKDHSIQIGNIFVMGTSSAAGILEPNTALPLEVDAHVLSKTDSSNIRYVQIHESDSGIFVINRSGNYDSLATISLIEPHINYSYLWLISENLPGLQ